MNAARRPTLVAVLALALSAPGCALFTKSNPVLLRYFTPETLATTSPAPGAPMAMHPADLDLRLGRVNAASYLKDRIAFRGEGFELGYYEDLRWTEKPEAYLRRALRRSFFEEYGVHQIVSGPGPTLEVDLDAFEELRSPRHAARLQVTWALSDDAQVETQETLTLERPITSGASGPGEPGPMAAAMAAVFDDAVRQVVARVMAALVKESGGKG
ncbi:MAG TPA: ABC-type transport auxiliary lipoprotein family protein [Polyangiaceae bacterium]